jgi:hypothetical protein
MRILIVVAVTALLTVPAHSQAGRGGALHPEEQKVDPAKKKADEKAFNDAVKRIPMPEKKYDPWGTVRQNSK